MAHTDPDPGADAADALFGGRLTYDLGWTKHEWARLGMGAWAVARRLPRMVARAGRLSWDADRGALLAVLGCELGRGTAAAFGLLATNQVLVELLSGGPTTARLRAALPALAWVAFAGIAASVMSAVSLAAAGRLEPRVQRLANVRLLERAARVELATIQDATFHNLLRSAQFGTDAARRMVRHSIGVLNALIGIVAAAGVLGVLHPLLLPLLVAITVPKGWATVRSNRRQYASIKAWLDHTRQQEVVASLLVDRDAAEEIRVHEAGPFLLLHYERLARAGEAEQARLARAEARTALAGDTLAGIATVATYALLALLLATGAVPLAVAGTAVLAIRVGTGNLGQLVDEVNWLYEQALYVTDLDEACATAEANAIPLGGVPAPADPRRITACGLSFTYPGADAPALDGVDVELRRGQVVALVGENGSGKTTLARLIAGLYQPTGGVLSWDGTPTHQLDRATIFDTVALISQDFMHWPFTAGVNVGIGRPAHAGEATRLADAAAHTAASSVIDGLPRRWETLLARQFAGGVDLSGGQWQRLALARGWFRDARILICDEPTASLDPRAEVEAFERIRRLAGDGHTVVLITHRLASVRHADHIYVLHHGRVLEHGSHEDLMSAAGDYAQLFALQAAQYGLG
jgi:ATP-binding cassette subfamily B protein